MRLTLTCSTSGLCTPARLRLKAIQTIRRRQMYATGIFILQIGQVGVALSHQIGVDGPLVL